MLEVPCEILDVLHIVELELSHSSNNYVLVDLNMSSEVTSSSSPQGICACKMIE